MDKWNRVGFGERLRTSRSALLPRMSQEKLSEITGINQRRISRWELEEPNVSHPDLAEVMALAEVFGWPWRDVALECGAWNTEIEERVLASIGGTTPPSPARAADGGKGLFDHPQRVASITPLHKRVRLQPVGQLAA